MLSTMTAPDENGELLSELDTQLEDGTPISIRPIRPNDIGELVAFHDRLSADTVYRRFFGPHPHLSPEEARRFTTVDYRDRFALVARCAGQLVAVVRFGD